MKQKLAEKAFLSGSKTTIDSAWPRWFSPPVLAAVFCALALHARAGVVLTTLHSFGTFENGSDLENALVQGTDGYLYGTARNGGMNGFGTVFKISTNGTLTSLYSFTGGSDGGYPSGALVQGSDGYFYGTTAGDNTVFGSGTVFKISTNGTLTSLYSFTGGYPNGLARGADGNFYGTTSGGGAHGQGSIFKISPGGTFFILYSFTGGSDGSTLLTPLVQGSDGYFYGTTAFGGQGVHGTNGGHGTVFQVSTNGMLTTLYSFTGGNDGSFPSAIVQGGDGNFYGTTYYGGTSNLGTIFKINSSGVYASLFSFTGGDDGASPWAGLVQASDGDFYGVTQNGGTNGGGTVFTISTNGALTSLYAFTGSDGTGPLAPLIQASDDYFYGVTYGGTVFKISAGGMFTTLYNFTADDGSGTEAALVQGSDGYFYGTASSGGSKGLGTVFKISANGTLTSLYSFTGGDDGSSPGTALVEGPDGYFYGTTFGGGTNDAGTIFGINSTGVYTNLYVFSGGNDGGGPNGLVRGSDGYFYGTTRYGGTDPFGTVFQITTNGTLTSLYSFTNGNDGFDPLSALVQGNDGYFYGTTGDSGPIGPFNPGSVFKISANGMLTTLYTFPGAVGIPSLVQGTDGTVYGTTNGSGTQGVESIFEITPSGTLDTLYSFPGSNDGSTSLSALMQGNDGCFYGTTIQGGLYYAGTVFRIDTNGALTSLYSFTDGNDGGYPQAALVQGSDGSFYGTTSGGGENGAGTVFRLTIVPECQAVTFTNSTLNLEWCTEAGGSYQLQYTSDLGLNKWDNLGDAFIATGSTLNITDSVTNGPQRFYRLMLAP
jgi:uncharacterized repeat protein (TIGR03803 family)